VGDLKKLGRIGIKSLVYFEVVSTLALVIGLVVVNVLQPGVGITPAGTPFHADAGAVTASQGFADKAHALSTVEFILNIIPATLVGAFVSGDLLQVLLVAVLVALAITFMGERGKPLLHAIDCGSQVFFGIMNIVVKLAPIGAFGAMGYTVGAFGIGTLNKLLALMGGFYLTAGLFVVFGLGGIALVCGFSIFRFVGYIKDELLLVLGTSSSETALPGIPLESLAMLVGIDRFMSECRAITNLIGNGVATVAISRWEKELTPEVLRANLRARADFPQPAVVPDPVAEE
jgi:aerobic C4-dicarboxylate transport protein